MSPYSNGVSVSGEVDEVLELVDVYLSILFALEVAIGFESHEHCGCLFFGQNVDTNSSVKSLHDAKHIFPDRNSCRKIHSAKLTAHLPLE
jgi:hypothetical protein